MDLAKLQQNLNVLVTLEKKIGTSVVQDGLRLRNEARRFGMGAHAGQQYYGTMPFVNHLEHVEEVLIRYDFLNSRLRAAAWLHDLDHTNISPEQIRALFPGMISRIANALRKREGTSRVDGWHKTLKEIRSNTDRASLIKIAERIANVEVALLNEDPSRLHHFRDHHALFRSVLYVPNECDRMWVHLDSMIAVARR